MKKRLIAMVAVVALVMAVLLVLSSSPSGWRFQHDHGVDLPNTIADMNMCGDHWLSLMDHGRVAFITLDEVNCATFIAELEPQMTSAPSVATGDPGGSTGQIFPGIEQYVMPANRQYVQLAGHWGTNVTPINGFGCRSRVGDYLRVEQWQLASGAKLLKVYTDWN